MIIDGGQAVIIAGMIATGIGQWFTFRSKMADVKLQIKRLHACVHDGIITQARMHAENRPVQQATLAAQQVTLAKVEEIADKISDGKRD